MRTSCQMNGLCCFVDYSVVLNVGEEHEAQQIPKVFLLKALKVSDVDKITSSKTDRSP